MANAVSSSAPIYLVGPTSSGKTDVAVALAEAIGAEIVGADAFQVYRGLDLLTAKPDAGMLARVPHHLISEIPLGETFDVARFRTLAVERIAQIQALGKTALVVGGTGLYVRALTHGLADLPAADAALRADLEKQPLTELVSRLGELDPQGAALIDCHNPRRVIRALEVTMLTGRPFSSFREQPAPTQAVGGFLVMRQRDELYARIDARVRQMFCQGVVEEVRRTVKVSATAAQAIGWREIQALLAGQISEAECIARIQQLTRNYAKRQLTWFRRESYFTPITISSGDSARHSATRLTDAIRAHLPQF